MVVDNYVYSFPIVQSEIPNGRSQITGNFTIEEAQDLANVLKAGKLPAPARIVEEAVVGPSLGKESINAGLISFIIAFIGVLCICHYTIMGQGMLQMLHCLPMYFSFLVFLHLSEQFLHFTGYCRYSTNSRYGS